MGTMQIPIPPATMKTRTKNRNKTIDLINTGEINIIKATGLTEISFKFLLPNADYPFNQSTMRSGARASYYVDTLKQLKQSQDPFQFIVVRMTDGGELLGMDNLRVTLEDFDIEEDAREGYDFYADVRLKQYREWGAKKLNMKADSNGKMTATPETTRSTVGKADTPKTVAAKAGDTLLTICKQNLGPMAMDAAMGLPFLKKLNKIAIPAILTAGQIIRLSKDKSSSVTSSNGGFISGTVLY